MADLKQVIISIVTVFVSAAILAAMVLYTVFTMRQLQLQILTGELPAAQVEAYIVVGQ